MAETTLQYKRTLRQTFAALKTLTAMQVKEKMDISYLRSVKTTIFHFVYLVLEFVAITAICYLLLWAAKLLGVFSNTNDVPVSVMAIVFTFMFFLSVLFTTIGLVNSLYLSKDNLVLLTLPATPSLVFLSKLLVYYVYELKRSFMFLIPLFFAYGLVKGYPIEFYAWSLFLFVFISMLPVLLGALLSMPALYVYQLFRKVKVLQYIVISVALGLGIGFIYYLIGLIPSDINFVETWGTTYWQIQDFLTNFTNSFVVMTSLTQLIVGKTIGLSYQIFTQDTVGHLCILVGSVVALLTLDFLLSKPLFYSMASKPFEYTKKMMIKAKKNEKVPVFFSAIKKEWIIRWRDNGIVSLIAQLIIIMPMAIELLNSIYAAMNTKYLGTQMTVGFNLLIVMLFMLSANISLASIYSRDGASSYLNKVQPSTYFQLLFAKLTPNLVFGLIGIVITSIMYANHSSLDGVSSVLFGATAYFAYVAHMFWSAELDIMNPQYDQYATFAQQINNPNENKSTLIAFIEAFLFAFVAIFLSMEGVQTAWIKISIIALVLAVLKATTYVLKIKVFYKEK